MPGKLKQLKHTKHEQFSKEPREPLSAATVNVNSFKIA